MFPKMGEVRRISIKSIDQIVKKYGKQLSWQWNVAQQFFKVTLRLTVK